MKQVHELTIEQIRSYLPDQRTDIPMSERLECQICYKRYTNKKNLKVHLRIVHDKRGDQANEYLPAHLRPKVEVIPEENKLKCPKCSKFYNGKTNLRCHMRTTHQLSMEQLRSLLPDVFTIPTARKYHQFEIGKNSPCDSRTTLSYLQNSQTAEIALHSKTSGPAGNTQEDECFETSQQHENSRDLEDDESHEQRHVVNSSHQSTPLYVPQQFPNSANQHSPAITDNSSYEAKSHNSWQVNDDQGMPG